MAVLSQWYKKLKITGFNDIEDEKLQLIKKWTGVSDFIGDDSKSASAGNWQNSLIDLFKYQEPESPIGNIWPEINFKKEQDFLNHSQFEATVESLFCHGNNAISPANMTQIWIAHCDGASLREIAKRFNIHNSTVYRSINKLRETIDLMVQKEDDATTVVIRAYNPASDAPLVFASWRNALWFDKHTNEALDPKFYRLKTKEIKAFLSAPGVSVRIACLQDNPDQIVGYAALSNLTIEFVYTKQDYRNLGIATLLVKGFHDVATPSTKIGASIAKNHKLKIKENKEDGFTERTKEESI